MIGDIGKRKIGAVGGGADGGGGGGGGAPVAVGIKYCADWLIANGIISIGNLNNDTFSTSVCYKLYKFVIRSLILNFIANW